VNVHMKHIELRVRMVSEQLKLVWNDKQDISNSHHFHLNKDIFIWVKQQYKCLIYLTATFSKVQFRWILKAKYLYYITTLCRRINCLTTPKPTRFWLEKEQKETICLHLFFLYWSYFLSFFLRSSSKNNETKNSPILFK
jgi:hypothetical protein